MPGEFLLSSAIWWRQHPPEEFLRQWTPSDIRKMVYEESDTDMLDAIRLPMTDLYRDGLSPLESCADIASRDPDRTIFWSSVNPLEGRRAPDLMERQVGEFGAGVQVSTTCATTSGRRIGSEWTIRSWHSRWKIGASEP